jgi:hypothetical protein
MKPRRDVKETFKIGLTLQEKNQEEDKASPERGFQRKQPSNREK